MCIFLGSSSEFFQCQPWLLSSGSLVFTPNISDYYFDSSNVEELFQTGTLRRSSQNTILIYPESTLGHSCRGLLRSMQYCYHTDSMDNDTENALFNLMFLDQAELNFTVNRMIPITSDDNLAFFETVCSAYFFTDEIRISPYSSFGIFTGQGRLFAFNDTNIHRSNHSEIEWISRRIPGKFTADSPKNRPSSLIRFYIGKDRLVTTPTICIMSINILQVLY